MPQPQKLPIPTFLDRWYGKLALLLLSVLLLTLALAPINQFYLAWVGLVPWLCVVSRCQSQWRAFLWSWLAGMIFFAANMWWLAYVTLPGMMGLIVYLGLYWGVAAIILRACSLPRYSGGGLGKGEMRHNFLIVLGIATVWTAIEWVRGNLFTGLPWLYLGHMQSPLLMICQIADVFGVYGITFCVAAVNALVFLYIRGIDRRALSLALAVVLATWIACGGYGFYRLRQAQTTCSPGPIVLLVQPNYPQDNTGEKGATQEELLNFHVDATEAALGNARNVDLVCWSETMMPGLNEEYRQAMQGARRVDREHNPVGPDIGVFLDDLVQRISDLARDYNVNVLTGGLYEAHLIPAKRYIFADRRNSAYLFRREGAMATERYDKIHLVPFGEFIPFKHTPGLRWLYSFFNSFSPYDFDYTLSAGSADNPTVFTIHAQTANRSVRFITPICFEDLDAGLMARMFRGNGQKRADLLVNLTNDGWFKGGENAQHLQAAVFRSIENRVPIARSVNTGISGFIDSSGRVTDTIAARTEGTAVATVQLDSRYTLFTRFGDWFAKLCAILTLILAVRAHVLYHRTRSARAT